MPRLNTALTGPSYCPFLLLLRYVVLALVFFSGLLLRHASPQKSRNVLPHVELGRQRIRSRATFGEFTPTTLYHVPVCTLVLFRLALSRRSF